MGKSVYQYYTVICANLVTLGYGIALGWTSPVLPLLQHENSPLRFGSLNDNEISWVGASLCIGGLTGQVLFSWVVDEYGRKWTSYLSALALIVNWTLILFATNVFHLYVARFFVGFCASGIYLVVPLYVSEISENRIRGKLGLFLVLSCNVGIVLGFIGGEFIDYYTFAYCSLINPVVFMIGFLFVPETPRFLQLKERIADAEKSIRFFQGPSAQLIKKPDPEFIGSINSVKYKSEDDDTQVKQNSCTPYCNPAARKGILISFVVMLLTQASGLFFLINYTSTIFKLAGSSLSPNVSSIIVGLLQLFGTAVSVVLVERFGRKILLALSSFLTSISLIGMGTLMYLQYLGYDLTAYGWMSIVCLSSTVFFASVGILSLPFVIVSEILPIRIRGVISSLCLMLQWVIAFILLKYYQLIFDVLKPHGCMAMFGGFCLFETIFVSIYMPETKGRSIDTIVATLNA